MRKLPSNAVEYDYRRKENNREEENKKKVIYGISFGEKVEGKRGDAYEVFLGGWGEILGRERQNVKSFL
jgi:hypothetical protein